MVLTIKKNNLDNAIPILLKLMEDKDYNVWGVSLESLNKLTKKDYGKDKAGWLKWWEENKHKYEQ